MITIQGFAKLCGCTTQTLRYYDRTGILKPAKVDEWTGYRYYEEEQALQFVKIKNLQQADFSIEEIRDLLPGDDDLLAAALDRKIREQREKLERMEKIQRSYLREKMDIQNVITLLGRFMEGQIKNPGLWKEFGLEGEKDAEIRARAEDTLVSWLADLRDASAELDQQMDRQVVDEIMKMLEDGNSEGKNLVFSKDAEESGAGSAIPADAQQVFERSGWQHVSEWIRDLPEMRGGKQDYFLFRVREDSPVAAAGFPTVLLAVMDALYGAAQGGITCKVERSDDGANHFALLEK